MLKHLSIENYQSHKSTKLEFVPGLNVLVGQSQNGKTAVLRALNWLLTNRPTGSAFRSFFAGPKEKTSVHVDFAEGTYIAAEKGKTGSPDYYVGAHNKGEDRYRKVGKAVPDAVGEVANLGEINTQAQLDPAFLVTAGKGEVSRIINGITGVDVADRWIRALNRQKRTAKATSDARTRDIREAKEGLKRFAGLDKADEYLTRAEQQNKRLRVQEQRAQAIGELKHKAGLAEDALKYNAGTRRGLEQIANPLMENVDNLTALLEKALDLNWALRCSHNAQTVGDGRDVLERLHSRMRKEHDQWVKALNKMALIEEAQAAHEHMQVVLGQREGVVMEYAQVLEAAKVCPVCRSPITGDIIRHIMEVL